jgi:predicted phosphohydrolase
VLLGLTSDTHQAHQSLEVPPCDVLVHAGDFSRRRGDRHEASAFLQWFSRQPAAHRVLVAGNHDCVAEEDATWFRAACLGAQVTYLEDDGVVIDGVSFWGSPVTPAYDGLAFNRTPGAALGAHWALIPHGLDVLITHGPPAGVLDLFHGASIGCAQLREAVRAKRPRFHLFGHVHDGRGEATIEGVRFVNGCAQTGRLDQVRPVVLLEV